MPSVHPALKIGLMIASVIVLSFIVLNESTTSAITSMAEQLRTAGAPGIPLAFFMIAVLVLDILLPIPSSLTSVYIGTHLGLSGGFCVIWLGLSGGSLLGYGLGHSLYRFLPKAGALRRDIERTANPQATLDSAAIILMRGVPVLAETSVIAAGALRFPLGRFVLLTSLANAGIAWAYAFVGSRLAQTLSVFAIVVASVALPTLALVLKWLADKALRRCDGLHRAPQKQSQRPARDKAVPH